MRRRSKAVRKSKRNTSGRGPLKKWRPTDPDGELAWNLSTEVPNLPSYFRGVIEVRASVRFFIFRNRREMPEVVDTEVLFDAAEFWSNFFAAVRHARSDVLEARQLRLNDEDIVPCLYAMQARRGR